MAILSQQGEFMLQIGNYNQLTIDRINASGAVLKYGDDNILLPLRLVPSGSKAGDQLNLFVYVDSDNRLTATTRKPYAAVGDYSLLKVRESTTVGAFLDWGLEKDLLLPFGEQTEPVRRGSQVLVRVYLHSSGRIAATMRLEKFLQTVDGSLAVGEEVDLLVYAFTDLGAKVIINGSFGGLVFTSEFVLKPTVGERLSGYVKKIREDGKIDVTLRMGGTAEIEKNRAVILAALAAHGGLLPLSDKSSSESIAALLRMSKKSFKKGIGGLYKEGVISILADCICLCGDQSGADVS